MKKREGAEVQDVGVQSPIGISVDFDGENKQTGRKSSKLLTRREFAIASGVIVSSVILTKSSYAKPLVETFSMPSQYEQVSPISKSGGQPSMSLGNTIDDGSVTITAAAASAKTAIFVSSAVGTETVNFTGLVTATNQSSDPQVDVHIDAAVDSVEYRMPGSTEWYPVSSSNLTMVWKTRFPDGPVGDMLLSNGSVPNPPSMKTWLYEVSVQGIPETASTIRDVIRLHVELKMHNDGWFETKASASLSAISNEQPKPQKPKPVH